MQDYTTIIQNIKTFFNWLEGFLSRPFGWAIVIVVVILAGVWYGEYKQDKGKEISKDEIQQLEQRISFRNQTIKADSVRILNLEKKKDSLQSILATRDCTDEVLKYRRLFDAIEMSEVEKTEQMNRRLRELQTKTKEMKQTLKL